MLSSLIHLPTNVSRHVYMLDYILINIQVYTNVYKHDYMYDYNHTCLVEAMKHMNTFRPAYDHVDIAVYMYIEIYVYKHMTET